MIYCVVRDCGSKMGLATSISTSRRSHLFFKRANSSQTSSALFKLSMSNGVMNFAFLFPDAMKFSKFKWLNLSRLLNANKRSRAPSATSFARHMHDLSLPNFSCPSGTSTRTYPTPWQYGQFGSPSVLTRLLISFEEFGELAVCVSVRIFDRVLSIFCFISFPLVFPTL